MRLKFTERFALRKHSTKRGIIKKFEIPRCLAISKANDAYMLYTESGTDRIQPSRDRFGLRVGYNSITGAENGSASLNKLFRVELATIKEPTECRVVALLHE